MGIYWDINEIKSYNALFNFVIGERGNGKTYGCKVDAIKEFLEKGNEFIYLRRYETEMKKAKNEFVNDILDIFKEHEFKVRGDKLLINGVVCCYFIVLTKAKLYKSIPFPKVKRIIFDEFLIKQGSHRYLTNEVDGFLDLYETINRTVMRETEKIEHTKVYFIANSVTVTNPYFLYFDVELPKNKKSILRQKSKDIVIQMIHTEEFSNIAKTSRVGLLLKGTKFFNHAYKNEFSYDREDFVRQAPKDKHYIFTLKTRYFLYGVWRDRQTGFYYVNEKVDNSCRFKYTFQLENQEPNIMLVKGNRRNSLVKNFIDVFKNGGVYYDSVNTQNIITQLMKGLV